MAFTTTKEFKEFKDSSLEKKGLLLLTFPSRYFGGKFKMTKSTYPNPVQSALEFVNNCQSGQEPHNIAGFQI